MKTFILTVLTAFFLVSCGQSGPHQLEDGETLVIVASMPHLACLAMNIAGDAAEVQLLPPENANPHSFEPSTAERAKIQGAHLLIINGLNLEPWDASKLADSAGATLVDCGKLPASFLTNAEEDHDHDHHHGASNPHVWLSSEGAILQASLILKAMQKADSANNDTYKKNFDTFKLRLNNLKTELSGMLKGLSSTAFVSNHDAFPYFAREFELEQVGVVQLTQGHNPSVAERKNLVATIKSRGAKAIFVEVGFDDKSAKTIAQQAGIKLGRLDPATTGKPTTNMLENALRANVKEILRVLG